MTSARSGRFTKPNQSPAKATAAGSVADVRRKLGLSRRLFSRLTGFSERAIANWESGGQPDQPGQRRIRETARFEMVAVMPVW
jgi:DNA-binding transcriptional regulator YiaG